MKILFSEWTSPSVGQLLRKSIAKPRDLGEDAQVGQNGHETKPPMLQLRQQKSGGRGMEMWMPLGT